MPLKRTSRVWSVFERVRDGKEMKFRVEDLPRENLTDLLQFVFENLVIDEPLHKALGIARCEESLEEYKAMMQYTLEKENIQMNACFLVDAGKTKLVGGSIMVLESDNVHLDKLLKMIKTDAVKKMVKIKFRCKAITDGIMKKLNCSYFSGRGISVSNDYRNLGIAGELLKARVEVCRHYGVPITGAWMSSFGSQKAATKLGWETITELKFDDIAEVFNIEFDPAVTPPTCKLMVFKL